MTEQELYDNVYGVTYQSAEQQMQILNGEIELHNGQGFGDAKQAAEWAHDHQLDKLLFSNMSHKFFCISHKGEVMTAQSYDSYYGNILFYEERQGNKVMRRNWVPKGYEYYAKAYIAAEQSDGVHRPLYYRDYTVPTGFYSTQKDAFNVAKPFPVYAKETGRDTSHIYTYINHIAGECSMWLLAWLRAKLLYPTVKTQVVPIIVSRAQGSGKTTFAEVICKGLFGKENVIVSDQYDSTARFNADYADALIVCQEEKELEDRRNPAGALKSRATATTIRKELKGVDPIYQESYTDFIMTTNKDVPIKFDGREDQRRFMIMEADEHFTRKESQLADEVFTKLYGYDGEYNQVGVPFQEDAELVAQFKHELFTRADIAAVKLRQFPKTAAYNRCFTLPRTSEATEIESILRALAPFIKESLVQNKIVLSLKDEELSNIIAFTGAMQYVPPFKEHAKFIALCRPLVFYEASTNKPFTHSVVERTIYDCGPWLLSEYGIAIIPDMEPLLGGFTNVQGRYRLAAAAKFCLIEDMKHIPIGKVETQITSMLTTPDRIGKRLRVDKNFKPNEEGCFETVNEMQPGTTSLTDKSQHVQYMDTFLLESDTPSAIQSKLEQQIAEEYKDEYGAGATIKASELYKERLKTSYAESMNLFNKGIVARVVYSGAKSYHLLIRVADSPATLEEYKWLHAYLCNNISNVLVFDECTADPARLTRSPLTLPRVTAKYDLLVEGEQKLVAEDWRHVYTIDWRPLYVQWKNRPLTEIEKRNGKPLYPTRQEYQKAAGDIITGRFWSAKEYDGDRQRLFFPTYRLLRVLGYSHNDIWNEIIPEGLVNYKKKSEIGYWKSRANAALIKQMDAEIDDYNEQWENKE